MMSELGPSVNQEVDGQQIDMPDQLLGVVKDLGVTVGGSILEKNRKTAEGMTAVNYKVVEQEFIERNIRMAGLNPDDVHGGTLSEIVGAAVGQVGVGSVERRNLKSLSSPAKMIDKMRELEVTSGAVMLAVCKSVVELAQLGRFEEIREKFAGHEGLLNRAAAVWRTASKSATSAMVVLTNVDRHAGAAIDREAHTSRVEHQERVQKTESRLNQEIDEKWESLLAAQEQGLQQVGPEIQKGWSNLKERVARNVRTMLADIPNYALTDQNLRDWEDNERTRLKDPLRRKVFNVTGGLRNSAEEALGCGIVNDGYELVHVKSGGLVAAMMKQELGLELAEAHLTDERISTGLDSGEQGMVEQVIGWVEVLQKRGELRDALLDLADVRLGTNKIKHRLELLGTPLRAIKRLVGSVRGTEALTRFADTQVLSAEGAAMAGFAVLSFQLLGAGLNGLSEYVNTRVDMAPEKMRQALEAARTAAEQFSQAASDGQLKKGDSKIVEQGKCLADAHFWNLVNSIGPRLVQNLKGLSGAAKSNWAVAFAVAASAVTTVRRVQKRREKEKELDEAY